MHYKNYYAIKCCHLLPRVPSCSFVSVSVFLRRHFAVVCFPRVRFFWSREHWSLQCASRLHRLVVHRGCRKTGGTSCFIILWDAQISGRKFKFLFPEPERQRIVFLTIFPVRYAWECSIYWMYLGVSVKFPTNISYWNSYSWIYLRHITFALSVPV